VAVQQRFPALIFKFDKLLVGWLAARLFSSSSLVSRKYPVLLPLAITGRLFFNLFRSYDIPRVSLNNVDNYPFPLNWLWL
jgi:hypothetical protein